MNALQKSLQRSNAMIATVQTRALQQKAGGMVDGLSPSVGTLSDWHSNAKDRERYSQFRGWLYAAVNALASEAAGQPVNVGRLAGDESPAEPKSRPRGAKARHYRMKMTQNIGRKAADHQLEVLPNHQLLRVLEHPNPIQYKWQFVYSFIANLCLTGWSYIVADQPKGKRGEPAPVNFYSLPTTWVRPDHRDGPFSRFKIVNPRRPSESSDDKDWLDRSQVGFAYLPNPSDPLSAMAPAASQQEAIKIDTAIQKCQSLFFDNGVFPSVVVTIGKDPHPDVPGGVRPRLTAPQRRQVIGAIRKSMGSVANYGNPAIVDGMIESIERLSATQNEIGWEKSETTVRTRILSAFGVHPYILGEPVGVGGYAQAAKIEERFCKRVNTYLDMLSILISEFARATGEDSNLLVWWEKTEPHDPSLHWTNVRAARSSGDITQNEMRAMLGLPPDEDRNESVISGAQVSSVIQLLGQVGAGTVTKEQARAVLVGMGLPDELAEEMAEGPEPPEPPPAAPGGPATPPKPVEGEEEEGEEEEGETEMAQATRALKRAVGELKATPESVVDRILGAVGAKI